jgi:hypothetical protein
MGVENFSESFKRDGWRMMQLKNGEKGDEDGF